MSVNKKFRLDLTGIEVETDTRIKFPALKKRYIDEVITDKADSTKDDY
ncbi:MAG: hypothetical protein A4E63_01199 [Syntrophorhabdus sp. PtaU1.Bin050]|nr:MAG: hypothetical protein A4E63_01199 [Syntrophorhabdus sp. PtaU1.Bin050]